MRPSPARRSSSSASTSAGLRSLCMKTISPARAPARSRRGRARAGSPPARPRSARADFAGAARPRREGYPARYRPGRGPDDLPAPLRPWRSSACLVPAPLLRHRRQSGRLGPMDGQRRGSADDGISRHRARRCATISSWACHRWWTARSWSATRRASESASIPRPRALSGVARDPLVAPAKGECKCCIPQRYRGKIRRRQRHKDACLAVHARARVSVQVNRHDAAGPKNPGPDREEQWPRSRSVRL